MSQPGEQQGISMETVAAGYGRRFSALLSELVQAEAALGQLQEELTRVRTERDELARQVASRRTEPDPGAMGRPIGNGAEPPHVVDHTPPGV